MIFPATVLLVVGSRERENKVMTLVVREHGGDGGNRPPGGGHRLPTTCESSKNKRGRGRNLNLIDEYSKTNNTPLPVVFDATGETFKCVGKSHSKFIRLISNEVATSIPPYYSKWSKVPAKYKDRIYAKLNHFFDIEKHKGTDNWGEIVEAIQADCASRYRGRKSRFKKHFLEFGGYGNVNRAKANPPENMDRKVWEDTIDKLFLDSGYRHQSRVNITNKKLQKYGSNHGTSSIAQKRYEEEENNPNEASLVRGWQKRHMKNGKWCNRDAEDDFGKILAELEAQRQAVASSVDPSPVDEAIVLRNTLGEGRCHNRGVGRKLKSASRYPPPTQTTEGTSSTSTVAAMEEKILGMQQVMGMMYHTMQQMQQALGAQNPNYQPPMQFNDTALAFPEFQERNDEDPTSN